MPPALFNKEELPYIAVLSWMYSNKQSVRGHGHLRMGRSGIGHWTKSVSPPCAPIHAPRSMRHAINVRSLNGSCYTVAHKPDFVVPVAQKPAPTEFLHSTQRLRNAIIERL